MLVVLRGGLSRRGKSKSPSLTDSFAPFWSFRKGPAGGRSPSEMVAEDFLLSKSDFCLRCCPPCLGRSFLLVQKGTKDTPERGDSDFPPLWTLPLETANTGGSCGSPLLDVPPRLLYCQAIRIGDSNGAQRSGSIWEMRGKGAEREIPAGCFERCGRCHDDVTPVQPGEQEEHRRVTNSCLYDSIRSRPRR